MFGIGVGEATLILVISAVLGDGIIVPLVGLWRARRRLKEGRRSVRAVVWSSINLALFGGFSVVLAVTGKPAVGPILALVLNGLWVQAALKANRTVPRAGEPMRLGS